MYLRRSTISKYFVVTVLAVILYSEWLAYVIQPLFWNNLECEDPSKCRKILFIADPQIQGEKAVPLPLSLLVNWDSDRYLKSTFSVVIRHFKPDVLVYLGDLMDEGSIATMPEFHSYIKRLSNIFTAYYPVTQIWLPGDNDIGGENEPIRQDKVTEFNRVFNQPSLISFKNITFYKINAVMYKVPEKPELEDTNIKIGVSHYPVVSKRIYGQQVDTAIHADIYFCAHEHVSKYVKQKNFAYRESHEYAYTDPVLNIALNDEWLYEIFVPTCSYRMGTSKIGYGAAIVENQQIKYTVFWSSRRFPLLMAYLLILPIILIYMFSLCCVRMLCKRRVVRRDDVLPLLNRT